MQQSIQDYMAFASTSIGFEAPIFEFGARQADAGGSADLRPLFPGLDYVGCDMQPGPGVERVLDLHAIDMPDASVPSVICLETLEHVEYPRRAVQEMHRILKPDGVLLTSSLMNFPIHNHPYDYWRFTPEGFRSLLAPFATVHVGWCGLEAFPTSVIGVGWKDERAIPQAFLRGYAAWHERMQAVVKALAERGGIEF